MGIVLLLFVVLVAVVIGMGAKIVDQSNMLVVERLGKFHSILEGGFHVIIPFMDRVVSKISTKEEMVQIRKQPVITKDNVTIHVDGIIFIIANDAKKATYQVVDYKDSSSSLAMTTIRSQIGSMSLDEILSSRADINTHVLTSLGDATANWGLTVTRVELSDISVPQSIEQAMSLQMTAEREKRAVELNAIAQKEATIRQAEGFKQEQILKAEAIERMADAEAYTQTKTAEAQKSAIEMINGALAENQLAGEFLLTKDRIAAFSELAKNPSSEKIIIPYEATQVLGSMSLLGEAFKGFQK